MISMFHTEKQIMLGSTPATQYKWFDATNNRPVAQFTLFEWWDGLNIEDFEVFKGYRGRRLSYTLLGYAVKLGAKNLAVKKDNAVALHVYSKYGFIITDSDDTFYYMTYKG